MKNYQASIDTLLSRLYQLTHTNKEIGRTVGRDVLRLIVQKLHWHSGGDLAYATLVIDQGHIADRLGISRRWVCEMVKRLCAEGYLRTSDQGYSNGNAGFPGGTDGLHRRPLLYRIGAKISQFLYQLNGRREKAQQNQVRKSPYQLEPPSVSEKKTSRLAGYQWEASKGLFGNFQAARAIARESFRAKK